jgi:hypothetical protein
MTAIFVFICYGEERSMKKNVETFKAALQARQAVKVIAGIDNLDLENILSVARAADAADAHAVDVAALPEIVRTVREVTSAVIFASGIEPKALAAAVEAGADVAELGNFDALYDQGLFLSAGDVLKLAEETMALIQGKALVSITVPGHLTLDSQVQLALALESLGVDILQTEGAARVLTASPTVKSLNTTEKADLTLRNTRALAKVVRTPLMTASGITADNVAMAFESGASAVGIGSYVNKAQDEAEMTRRSMAVMANRTRVLSHVG